MEETVTISLCEYRCLLDIQTKYETLINNIFNNAQLDRYSNYTSMEFSLNGVETLVKALDPIKYNNKLRDLRREKEKEDNMCKEVED